MFKRVRTRIGEYILRRESEGVNRNRSMVNLAGARTIGILYALQTAPDYTEVENFVTELQKAHKEVKALGFVQYKEMKDRFLPKLSYDFFSQKEVNWFYKPMNDKVSDFIRKDFDLLLDLTMEEALPLKFIAGMSRARCKVGRYSDDNNRYYDLMIKVETHERLPELIRQIKHYLTIIQQHE